MIHSRFLVSGNHPALRLLIAISMLLATVVAISAAAVMSQVQIAEATHLRSGSLTWKATGPRTAEFSTTFASRRSYFGSPNVGDTIQEPSIDLGDGNFESPLFEVVFIDTVNDFLIAEATFTHTYAGDGPYTAISSNCCRLSRPQHINNPDESSLTATIVNFAATSASPESSLSPIVDCPKDATCQFVIPAAAPAGQTLRFRFATAAEASGFSFSQPGPPNAPNAATIGASNGVYSWDTTGATLAPAGLDTFYSTQIVIESLVGSTVVSSSAVDFFIRLSDTASTNQAPVFTAPTPADGTVIDATIGLPVSFSVAATDPDAGDTVSLGMLGQPAGASYVTTPGNPATGTFSWTPTSTGTIILTLTAQDQSGLGAVQRSVTIQVSPGTTVDTTNPGCVMTATGKDASGKTYIQVTAQDTGSGIALIEVTKSKNANTVVPAFTPGTTDALVVVATKIDQKKSSQVELRVTDVAGNATTCDPILTMLVQEKGKPAYETIEDVPTAEGVVTITNGSKGLKAIYIVVNTTIFPVTGLKNNEVRVVDISSAMEPGDANTITLIADGPKGASAEIMIWDGIQ